MEYSKPAVVDYGSLKEVTAVSGAAVVDAPIGTPIGSGTGPS